MPETCELGGGGMAHGPWGHVMSSAALGCQCLSLPCTMAPTEIATLLENEHGSAFEVQIKSPNGDQAKPAVRERLESYARPSPKALPKLLGAKVAEERASKAWAHQSGPRSSSVASKRT